MNENKRIDTPNKHRKVRWRTQDENMRWITTKTNNGPNFQYTKFSGIELKLGPVANLLVADFCSQPREMPLPKQLKM